MVSYMLYTKSLWQVPIGEIVSCDFKRVFGLISWIELSMHNMRVRKRDCNKIVHMGRKASKARFIAHKAMNIHKKDSAQV
jgi:hypothetical protein